MNAQDAHSPTADRPCATPPRPTGFTSLDPHETSVDLPQSPVLDFRHSGWSRLRSAVWNALRETTTSTTRLSRFANCGTRAWVCHAEHDPTRLKLLADYCRDRFCRPCATARAQRLTGVLVPFLAKKSLRFVTLTLRSSDEPLAAQVKRLLACFRRLRQRQLWKANVSGGLAVLELTHSEDRKQWHPHLHVLTEGSFIQQRTLASSWLSVTGDSHIVDIRKVTDTVTAARYLTKYIAKGVPGSVLYNPSLAVEAVNALTGQRTFLCFGTWHGLKLTQPAPDEVWIPIDSLDSLIKAARRGNVIARDLLNRLRPIISTKSSRRTQGDPRAP